MIQIIRNKRGTALLTAILVMGILITVSIAIANLIFRESRIINNLLASGKAYYSAESGIEIALYNINNSLPGWEPTENGKSMAYVAGDTFGEIKVRNTCQAYPCFDKDEFNLTDVTTKEFYDALDLNESITIPLFIQNSDGTLADVKDFVVEYFIPFSLIDHLNIKQENLSSWDVLRWKLFGINEQHNVTESISDFTAASIAEGGTDENIIITTNASIPSWFGTGSCNDFPQDQRYNFDIKCPPYSGSGVKEVDLPGQVAKVFEGICLPTEAREYYFYNYFSDEKELNPEDIHGCYPIKQFLDGHKLNYLTLTNLINPAVFKDQYKKKSGLQKIYYRVELFGENNKTARGFANIVANGYSGENVQTIKVDLKRDSFIPVFHFSLYSTYKDKEAGHDFDYFYEEEEGL